MVTYWLTGYTCPSCGKTADTKMTTYPLEKDTKRFQEELNFIKKRITSELVTESSNGWPYPDYDSSWRIGLVKIRTGKKQHSMKCFLCGFTTDENKFKEYLEMCTRKEKFDNKSENIRRPTSNQVLLDNYLS